MQKRRCASLWFSSLLSMTLFFCTTGTSHAQKVNDSLSLQQVIESTQKYAPLIQAAQKESAIARAELNANQGAFDPQFRIQADGTPLGYYQNARIDARYTQTTPFWGTQLFAGYRLGLGQFASYDGKLETNQAGEIYAGIEVPLLRNGSIDRRRVDIKKAELGVALAETSILQQTIDTERVASHRYWDWVAAGIRLEVARKLLDLAAARNDWLKRRVSAGDLANIEQVDNERIVLQRQGFLAAAERSFQQAQIDLSLYLREENGNPVLAPASQVPADFPLAEKVLDESIEAELEKALAQRPEPKRFSLQKEQLQLETLWAKNQRLPLVSVYTAIHQDFGPGDYSRTPFGLDLGLKIEFPLLNRYAKGKQASAEASLLRTDFQLRFVKDQIKTEILSAKSILRMAQKRIDLAKEEILVTEETQEAEWKKYQRGDSNLLFVNVREQYVAEAKLRWIDAMLDYHKGQASYRAALSNTKLTTDSKKEP